MENTVFTNISGLYSFFFFFFFGGGGGGGEGRLSPVCVTVGRTSPMVQRLSNRYNYKNCVRDRRTDEHKPYEFEQHYKISLFKRKCCKYLRLQLQI